jgi:hypothetical protein
MPHRRYRPHNRRNSRGLKRILNLRQTDTTPPYILGQFYPEEEREWRVPTLTLSDLKERLAGAELRPVKGGILFVIEADGHQFALAGAVLRTGDGVEEFKNGRLFPHKPGESFEKAEKFAEGAAMFANAGLFGW